ncbi:MAG: hypothetical protein AAGF73_04490 [Actinomycetota bacterium]
MNKVHRAAVGTAAALGSFAVGFGVVAVAGSGGGSTSVGTDEIPDEVLSTNVSLADQGGGAVWFPDASVVVEARAGSSDDVCVTPTMLAETFELRCYPSDLISRGLAYASVSERTDTMTVGVVPDEVERVVLGGVDAPVEDNVWALAGPSPGMGADMVFIAADGQVLLSIDVDAFGGEPGTITTLLSDD